MLLPTSYPGSLPGRAQQGNRSKVNLEPKVPDVTCGWAKLKAGLLCVRHYWKALRYKSKQDSALAQRELKKQAKHLFTLVLKSPFRREASYR